MIVGAAVAPGVLDWLGLTGTPIRALAAAVILLFVGTVGSWLGFLIGEPLRSAIFDRGIAHPPELLAGALFSACAVLSVTWFLGLTFSRGPSAELARSIQRSVILRELDTILPRPPGFLVGVQKVLAGVPFPQTFASLELPNTPPLELPATVDTPQVRAARSSVFRVEGRGCGGIVSGSAYPVAPGYLITNAHVVSGTSGTMLSHDAGGATTASVVFFDPDRDVAILRAPSITAAPLAPGPAARGTQGAVVGYPGGGNEDVMPAVVDSLRRARGRDIYNNKLVDREIWILDSVVRPGNSGGPVIDLQGHVLGLVFAASSSNPSQAYALTNGELDSDIRQGVTATRQIDTHSLTCSV